MTTKNNKEKELVEVLKSGNFTIAYHDSGRCSLIKGKYKEYEDLNSDDEGEILDEIIVFDCDFEGYAPREVVLLAKALGGKAVSI